MRYKIQSVNFDADERLLKLVDQKVNKFKKFEPYIVSGDVILREEAGKAVRNKVVEIKSNVKGNTLFVNERRESFEAAVDAAVDVMERQLRKHKDKVVS